MEFILNIPINLFATPDNLEKLCFEIFPHIFINSILLIDKIVSVFIGGNHTST